MRPARHVALPAVVAAVVLVLLLALQPIATSRALAIWIVLVAALTLLVLVRRSRDVDASRHARRFETALRGRPIAPAPPVELVRMERELELGIASADHARRRLLPVLRAAAAARIGSRHGIELERQPERARAILGDDVWELVRPDRPDPPDRHLPGVPRERVVSVIERLESM